MREVLVGVLIGAIVGILYRIVRFQWILRRFTRKFQRSLLQLMGRLPLDTPEGSA